MALQELIQRGTQEFNSYDEQMQVRMLLSKGKRTIEDVVAHIGNRFDSLYEFAFEFRKVN